ncbi:tRNA uridine-5-carboxymethylaminomethyl(34) synthesis GTPase MnmE [Futiania mangrovi]|uniref:tRNA modification GTPase MnmE n=1 Tax=Futiania mangrovi TaxID=2959716 RepID=A0A9J6PKA9_9PROT|nr:tRNA uridine-5-carboxymethylaminomethyl(34) synthesis GTPase MnmE [Futiania mangrovii]MCP1336506.1 tRNA uridine-5-carboxymethylaminomethyl(34) synthesis GTPase MnmE [Futiania mangrovii]
MNDRDTIFALSTAAGRAGVAVIRVSGRRAPLVAERLCGRRPQARRAERAVLRHPGTGEALDDGLVLLFPAPRSFTGEDVLELQVHGSLAVVAVLLEVLSGEKDCRPAEPGEFTRRAFHNGKLDLTQVEGLADLIDATTEAQRRQARRQVDGALGTLYDGWRERLVRVAAHLEVMIDFPDEDVPQETRDLVAGQVRMLRDELRAHLDDSRRGERLRHGVSVVILGAPNAGKSSLLNLLAQREAAIVSEIAGTTRDVIEVHLDLGGYPVTLVDTAGLRETEDRIEAEGVRRTRARAADADIRLLVRDASIPGIPDLATMAEETSPDLVVYNKIDREGVATPFHEEAVRISCRTGAGVDTLLERLGALVRARFGLTEAPVLTRARHRRALGDCVSALERFLARDLSDDAPELAAEEIRFAVGSLGRITGRVDVEDLLDVVFRDFCIGK